MSHYSEPKVVTLEPMHVASYRAISMEPENDSIAFLQKWITDKGYMMDGQRSFGFDVSVDEEKQKQGLRGYEFWVTVPADAVASDGVVIKDYEGGSYAWLRIRDPFSDPFQIIPGGWETLVKWAREEGLQFPISPCYHGLEEVQEDAEGTYMDIYLPIKG